MRRVKDRHRQAVTSMGCRARRDLAHRRRRHAFVGVLVKEHGVGVGLDDESIAAVDLPQPIRKDVMLHMSP
jgi:hypothetical protein